jgi:hypothetical protein
MHLPPRIKIYGDTNYRGTCATETIEQVTFFNRLRRGFKDTYGLIALHPRNEGHRHFRQVAKEKAEGMVKGAADVIIVGAPAFVCEIKRRDHTKSQWQEGQQEFLYAAKKAGAFVCIALGADAAWEAFDDYLALREPERADESCYDGE